MSVEAAAALSGVGFEQVSEVMGAVAYAARSGGFYSAGAVPVWSSGGTPPFRWHRDVDGTGPPTYTSSHPFVAVGTPPSITAMKAGYRLALKRLVGEARAVGADGVVGVRITRTKIRSGDLPVWSFLASGSAIRSIGRSRAKLPFTTSLSAAQAASSIRAGWVPISYLACPVMAIRWVDAESRRQQRVSAANGEVHAHTEVVNTCRHQARTDFAAAAKQVHADGAVMTAMSLHLGHPAPLAEVTVVITGTALAMFATRTGVEPLTVIPLTGRQR